MKGLNENNFLDALWSITDSTLSVVKMINILIFIKKNEYVFGFIIE